MNSDMHGVHYIDIMALHEKVDWWWRQCMGVKVQTAWSRPALVTAGQLAGARFGEHGQHAVHCPPLRRHAHCQQTQRRRSSSVLIDDNTK